ncbi:MAG: hypothetical protein P8078_01375 [bacterium]
MNMKKYQLNFLFGLIIFILFAGCDTSTNPPVEPDIDSATLYIISGNNQNGFVGEQLEEPIVVQVVDQNNKPRANIKIRFTVVAGEGCFTSNLPTITSQYGMAQARRKTDQSGMAQVFWKIGEGYNAAQVSLVRDDIEVESVYFYATGDNPTGKAITRSLNTPRTLR